MRGFFISDGMAIIMTVFLVGYGASAQTIKNNAQTASQVSAELVKGNLNPASSKPGDEVALRLNDDMKSNGRVVLKKGSTITGVVRNVRSVDTKNAAAGQPRSMMAIEWIVPPGNAKPSKQIMVAVQSLWYFNPVFASGQQSSDADFAVAVETSASSGSNAGIVGGVLGNAPSNATSVGAAASMIRSNTAVLSMPSVVAVDSQTSAAMQSVFGLPNNPLFKTGRGEVVSAGGSKHRLDIFSHFSNDTVLISPSTNFEIASGARIQLLVGVQK